MSQFFEKERICLLSFKGSMVILVSMVIVLLSCTNKKKFPNKNPNRVIEIFLKESTPERYFKLSEFTDEIEYLKLETNDSCLLKRIDRLKVANNEIYISDEEKLLVFDRLTGKFKRKIGKTGKGPGEYVNIEDFVVLQNEKLIFITDLQTGLLHKLDINGKFIADYKLPHAPFKINGSKSNLISLYSYPDFLFNEMHSILVSDLNLENKKYHLNRSYTGLKKNVYGKISSTSLSLLEYFIDTLCYWEIEFDTLFRYSNDRLLPYISLNYEKDYVHSKIADIIETKNYVFLLAGVKSNRKELNHFVYSKPNKTIEKIKFNFMKPQFQVKAGIINDIDRGWHFLPQGLISANEPYCYFFKHQLDEFLESENIKKHNIPDFVIKSGFMDNPILMIIKLKD